MGKTSFSVTAILRAGILISYRMSVFAVHSDNLGHGGNLGPQQLQVDFVSRAKGPEIV